MSADFEERLYNHWIYTNNLYNLGSDLTNELQDRGYNVTMRSYRSGKYLDIDIEDPDQSEEIEEAIHSICEVTDPNYYGSLECLFNTLVISIYIKI